MQSHKAWSLTDRRSVFFTLFFLVFSCLPTHAQEARGTITGRVLDSSGAAVPGAPVVITNKAMGTKSSLTTTGDGLYVAPFLIPGQYQIEVEVSGFKKVNRDNVELRVNDRLEINIPLEIGASDQTITVAAETPLLDTATASSGQVIDSRRVSELPVPHGNPLFLIGLAPGTVSTGDPRLDRPYEPTHIASYGVDGSRGNRSDITLDGAPATARANPGEVIASYMPPADIIAEFKTQTISYDASVGQTEGAVTNLSIKSGTNSLHGTLYYSNFTPGLFANDFFANRSGTPRPDFSYHRWGGSLGGPIVIPKLYDGRNRTFFMYGYEGIADNRPRNNGNPTVPTDEMKNGDFSRLLGVSNQYQIYNPFTRRLVGNGIYQADPFPNNRIPTSLINPVGQNILRNYFPSPLQQGNANGQNNYQRAELTETAAYGTHTARVDHNISERQRLYARYSFYNRDSDYNNYFDNLSTGEFFQFQSRNFVIDDVITINPTTVLDLRYGYNRFVRISQPNPASLGFDLTSLGFPASYANQIPDGLTRFPRITLAGYQGTGGGGEFRPNDIHSIAASVQKTVQAHAVKFGFEFRAYRQNFINQTADQTGLFNFDSTWTAGPRTGSAVAPSNLGQSVASLLLGLPSPTNSFVTRAASYAEQSTAWGFYLQDDWRVNSRLTLNLGLRYELEGALRERYDRSVRGFDPSFVQPFAAQAQANYAASYASSPTVEIAPGAFRSNGGLQFAGVNGQSPALYRIPKTNFMPRFGFAFQLDNKTVLRGGYGIYYGFLGQRRGDVSQAGFSLNTPLVPSTDNGLTFTSTLSNPYGAILDPTGSSLGGRTLVGQSISFFNSNPVTPYMQRWQFSVQRQLSRDFVLDLAYVGNRGTNIELTRNINATPNQFLSNSPVRDQQRITYLSQNVPNPFFRLPGTQVGFLNSSVIARERLLRPYPQFDQVNTTTNDGYSWYHSFQLQLQKRFSKGYTLTAGYTMSKFMQATEFANPGDLQPARVISDQDFPHRLSLSGIYELPFGKNKQFFSASNSLVNGIIGGWQVNGVYQYQVGAPLGTSSQTGAAGNAWPASTIFTGNFNDIRLSRDQQSAERWINTDAGFVRTAANLIDPARQLRQFPIRLSGLRGDPLNNVDFGLFKNTRIKERYNLQIRGELLNAFNHPQFPRGSLILDPALSTFGSYVASTQFNYSRRVQLTAKFIF